MNTTLDEITLKTNKIKEALQSQQIDLSLIHI